LIRVDPANTSRLYLAGAYTVFRSENAGRTWNAADSGLNGQFVQSLAIDARHPGVLYAASGDEVFRTTSRGTTWIRASGDLPPGLISGVAISPADSNTLYAADSGVVYKTADGGVHWTPASAGIPVSSSPIHSIVFGSTSPLTIYAVSGVSIFRTTDGGQSWMPLDIGIETLAINALVASDVEPAVLYAATGRGVIRSGDGGTSWEYFNDGLTDRFVTAIGVSKTLYAGTGSSGIFARRTTGDWFPSGRGMTSGFTSAVTLDPTDPTRLYSAWTSDFETSFVSRSENSGASWTRAGSSLSFVITSLLVSPRNPSVVYASTLGSGVFRSANRGDDWTPVNDGLTNLRVRRLVLDPTDLQTLYATTDGGGIYIGGLDVGSWSLLSLILLPAVTDLAVDPSNGSRIYVATGGVGAFASDDRGQSWVGINNGLTEQTIRSLAVDPMDSRVLLAGTQHGLFRSIDAGLNWQRVDVGLPISESGNAITVSRVVFDPTNGSTVYLATLDMFSFPDSSPGIFKSTDKGASWVAWNSGLANSFVLDLAIDPTGTSLHAATQGGAYDITFKPSSFFTVNPCRLVDTRSGDGLRGGPLPAGSERVVPIAGNCGIPATARSVALNITVTGPTDAGYLTFYAPGTLPPETYSVAYATGRTRSNNGIVGLDELGNLAVKCRQPSGAVHIILDVSGYFE
jgi:photosystem II stability/assembly factor-like uncharacterized protein